MFSFLKKIFDSEPKPSYLELLQNNGVIIDVRTKQEYATGHIKGSKNIPLNTLPDNLNRLRNKEQPIITCCASGIRSAQAKQILKSNGFANIHNGGGWRNLQNKIA